MSDEQIFKAWNLPEYESFSDTHILTKNRNGEFGYVKVTKLQTNLDEIGLASDDSNIFTGTQILLAPLFVQASSTFLDDVSITGDLNVNGNINVSTIISSSVLYDSGSTIFGNTTDDIHDFIGDINVTGSVSIYNGYMLNINGVEMHASESVLYINGDIVPETNNSQSLGTIDVRWKDVWVGPGTIYIADSTNIGSDLALEAIDDNFVISGSAGLVVGEFTLRDNTIKITDSTRDIEIGIPTATGNVVFNRPVQMKNPNGIVTFGVSRNGRVELIVGNIPANDAGALNIIGNMSGSYQPVTQTGGMIHITGNDNTASRFTNDGFGVSGIPTNIARRARGTANSPEPIQSGDIISRYTFAGWTGDRFGQVGTGSLPTSIDVVATENFTGSTMGTEMQFWNAPNGTVNRELSTIVGPNGVNIPSGSLYVHGHKQFNVGSFQSNITQSGSANVSQSMQFETTDISYGVTMVSGSRMSIQYAGVYNIQFSSQVVADAGADDIFIWLKKNGTNVVGTTGRIALANNEEVISAWNYVVEVADNDYLEIAWQSTTGDAVLLSQPANSNYPALPSNIVTITQVR